MKSADKGLPALKNPHSNVVCDLPVLGPVEPNVFLAYTYLESDSLLEHKTDYDCADDCIDNRYDNPFELEHQLMRVAKKKPGSSHTCKHAC